MLGCGSAAFPVVGIQFIMTDDSSSDSDSDLEIVLLAVQGAIIAASSTFEFFNIQELDDMGQGCVDHDAPVRDYLTTIRSTPYLFQTITNFTAEEFEELCTVVCPVIILHARSTGQLRGQGGRPPKLLPEQRLLNFVMFLKHDNTATFDSCQWNWARSSVNDDSLFVASCIGVACTHEIKWPSAQQRLDLARTVPQLPGCIGFIDGTLCQIRRPFNNPLHGNWFNGRKKMYCLNNTVVVDHNGLFVYVDIGYPGKFHDVNILRLSDLFKQWRAFFTHNDEYFEYLLGDPGYVGEDMFIMRRIGQRELAGAEDGDELAIHQYNKMHAGLRVRVEWGIGGLKRKFKRLMKRFDNTKEKFSHLFVAGCILTNFIHRRRMDMQCIIIGDGPDIDNVGWDGDY